MLHAHCTLFLKINSKLFMTVHNSLGTTCCTIIAKIMKELDSLKIINIIKPLLDMIEINLGNLGEMKRLKVEVQEAVMNLLFNTIC